jgi:hypothetical protein
MHVELVIQPSSSNPSTSNPIAPKPKSKMFPVLVFLLVACYGVMAMVVVEQGNVIQSQRNLIHQLFQDSQQLASLKGQEAGQRAIEKKQAERLKQGQPSAHSAPAPKSGQACQSCRAVMEKNESQKNTVQKQPLQATDKADWRRFPAKI